MQPSFYSNLKGIAIATEKNAWERDLPLTPKGMDLMKDAFKDVNIREFRLNMQEDTASHTYNIMRK